MNNNDIEEFNKIKISIIPENEKITFKDLSFINKIAIFGLGWSYDYSEQSLWSDGERSSLIFKPENYSKKFKIIFDLEGYIRPKKNIQEVNIFVHT